jgi:hypothetical protein
MTSFRLRTRRAASQEAAREARQATFALEPPKLTEADREKLMEVPRAAQGRN